MDSDVQMHLELWQSRGKCFFACSVEESESQFYKFFAHVDGTVTAQILRFHNGYKQVKYYNVMTEPGSIHSPQIL